MKSLISDLVDVKLLEVLLVFLQELLVLLLDDQLLERLTALRQRSRLRASERSVLPQLLQARRLQRSRCHTCTEHIQSTHTHDGWIIGSLQKHLTLKNTFIHSGFSTDVTTVHAWPTWQLKTALALPGLGAVHCFTPAPIQGIRDVFFWACANKLRWHAALAQRQTRRFVAHRVPQL